MRVVIVGAGDVGTYLARALSSCNAEVIVVDRQQSRLDRVEEQADVLTLFGDATHWKTLREAGVDKADITLVMTSSDDANVVSAALSVQEGAQRAVARVDDPSFYRGAGGVEAGMLGIHAVLCASRLVSQELLRMVRAVDAECVADFAGNALQVAQVRLGDTAPVLGTAASSIALAGDAHVAGVIRDLVLRGPADVGHLEPDDSLLIAGAPRAIDGAIRAVTGARPHRRTVIIGGGDVGFQLARGLSETGRRVQVIELDLERCHFLAQALPDVTVIHGDGTNIHILRDEAVDRADFLLSVTRSDEVNLMASLLGADLGVPWTYALVHRPGYTEVYDHLGIHGTAGPHEQIWRMVQWMLPATGALLREGLPGCTHELFEYQLPGALPAQATLSDLVLPPEALVVAMVRGADVIRPRSNAELQAFDHLIIAAPASLAPTVERRLRGLQRGAE